jgi:hypothetical protein
MEFLGIGMYDYERTLEEAAALQTSHWNLQRRKAAVQAPHTGRCFFHYFHESTQGQDRIDYR